MKRVFLTIGLSAVTLFMTAQGQKVTINHNGNGIVYVNKNAGGSLNDGSSWLNAAKELADVLEFTRENPGNHGIQEIWVAASAIGYRPLYTAEDGHLKRWTDGNEDNSFVLAPNVRIFGGFAGRETSRSQRDWVVNETVLDGIVAQIGSTTIRTYHVVISAGNVGSACLDGFTIRNGMAYYPTWNSTITVNGCNAIARDNGGGIIICSSSPTLANLTIKNNVVMGYGGGAYITGESNPIFVNTEIIENASRAYGGGLCVKDCNSPLELSGLIVTSNTPSWGGGGIYVENAELTLFNVIISHNEANSGGVAGDGGGLYLNNVGKSCTLINVLLADNTAVGTGKGGAVYISPPPSQISPLCTNTMVNVTISGNKEGQGYQGVVNNSGQLYIYNSILWNKPQTSSSITPSAQNMIFEYSLVEGELSTLGIGCLDGTVKNPHFADTAHGDYRLKSVSDCVNSGSNILIAQVWKLHDVDLAGNPRKVGSSVDMGAYEYPGVIPNTNGIVYVKQGGSGVKDGSSWADASDNLASALQASSTNPAIQEIYVANGTYYPSTNTGFVLPDNVKCYGGFPANADDITHTSPSSRPVFNFHYYGQTILSGKIGGNSNNRSYHVVTALGQSYLDGFRITGGNANGVGIDIINGIQVPQYHGGGLYVNGDVELRNLEIYENFGQSGGGMAVIDYCPRFENISAYRNSAQFGGGIYRMYAALYAKNLHIFENFAQFCGGGFYCHDNMSKIPAMLVFENSSIHENSSQIGGGIYNTQSISLFHNALVYNNNGQNGASIYNDRLSTILFNHATITKTTIPMAPVEIISYGTFIIENSIICLQNIPPFTGNNYVNNGTCHHLFSSPYRGNYSLNLHLPTHFAVNTHNIIADLAQNTSFTTPCVNMSILFNTDIAGNPRGSVPDYGAFEYGSTNPFPPPPEPLNPDTKSMNNKDEQENKISEIICSDRKLQIYPNPTTGKITIRNEESEVRNQR